MGHFCSKNDSENTENVNILSNSSTFKYLDDTEGNVVNIRIHNRCSNCVKQCVVHKTPRNSMSIDDECFCSRTCRSSFSLGNFETVENGNNSDDSDYFFRDDSPVPFCIPGDNKDWEIYPSSPWDTEGDMDVHHENKALTLIVPKPSNPIMIVKKNIGLGNSNCFVCTNT